MNTKRILNLTIFVVVGVLAGSTLAEWSEPVLLPELNDAEGNIAGSPCLSRDGLTMYFHRYIQALGHQCAVEAYRQTPDGPFTSERVLTELSTTGFNVKTPWVSDDELRLYYTEYNGSYKEIKMAERSSVGETWTPVEIFYELHLGGYGGAHPSLTSDELIMFFLSGRPGTMGQADLWMATRPTTDGAFIDLRPLDEINSTLQDYQPCVLPDGLTLYFTSTRGQSGDKPYDIYKVTRSSTEEPFGNVQNISVNTDTYTEQQAYVTPDEQTIYFHSDRGAQGNGIWVSHWIEPEDPLENYTIETYASYYHPSPGQLPWGGISFDGYGNLYVNHKDDDSIYRIDPNGNAERWVDSLFSPRSLVWGGGTEYGENLYVASGGGQIYRIDLDGNVSTFATFDHGVGPVAIDRIGTYGGYMYAATRTNDHIARVLPNGEIQHFSDFPYGVSGGPGGIAFDPGTEYGGFMYVSCYTETSPQWNGIFRLNVNGNPTKFGSDRIIWPGYLEFDTTGLMFGGELFALWKISTGTGTFWGIYKVDPSGQPSPFKGGTSGFTFGPDGAMYIAGYSGAEETVIIRRIALLGPEGIAAKKIEEAIAKKIEAMEKINVALEKEAIASEILEELLASNELGDLTRPDILKAKADIRTAIVREQQCKADLTKSIRKLDSALDSLGWQAQPNVLLYDVEQADLLQADLNADGVINQLDFAVLADYWLKSYQIKW